MTDDSSHGRLGPYRRDVMKAVTAGVALGVVGGTAAAEQHEESDDDNGSYDPDEPAERTVHVVRTLITQSTHPDRPADFFYEPTGLHVEPGDVVKFVFETPDHTVTSYHPAFGMQRRIPSGVAPFSSPVLGWDPRSLPDDIDEPPAAEPSAENDEPPAANRGPDDENGPPRAEPEPSTWLYAFETPGVYDMECAPHEAYGMAMRVVAGDETETTFETSDPEELPPPRAGPVGLSRQVLTDPNLEPDRVVEEGRVEWMDLEANQRSDDDSEE